MVTSEKVGVFHVGSCLSPGEGRSRYHLQLGARPYGLCSGIAFRREKEDYDITFNWGRSESVSPTTDQILLQHASNLRLEPRPNGEAFS